MYDIFKLRLFTIKNEKMIIIQQHLCTPEICVWKHYTMLLNLRN